MEQEILKKLEENNQKIEEVFKSVEKTRKYYLWTLYITLALILLPGLGLLIAIPKFLSTYSSISNLGL